MESKTYRWDYSSLICLQFEIKQKDYSNIGFLAKFNDWESDRNALLESIGWIASFSGFLGLFVQSVAVDPKSCGGLDLYMVAFIQNLLD